MGDGPVGEGSRVARVASFLGRRVEYTFEPRDGGTVVRNRVRGGGGWLSLGSPAFAPLVKRSVQRDLERLRDVLEG